MDYLPRPEGYTADDLKFSRRALGGLFFSGYAVSAVAAEAQPITTDAEGLTIEEVTYPTADGRRLPAYVARPAKPGKHPVILLVSEIFGVHAYTKDMCRRLAKQGYVAIAPAFFFRAGDPSTLSDMGEVMKMVATAGNEQVMGDVGATLDWASKQSFADGGRMGITGHCWGGTVVWMACARFSQFDAGVAWYGRVAAPADPARREAGRKYPVEIAGDLKCPVLGLYAEKDGGIPLDTVEQMRQALRAAGRNDEIVVYPGVQHGFHADYRASYDKAAAEAGWARMLAFFKQHV